MLAETNLSDLYAFQFGALVAARKGPQVDADTEVRARRVVEKFTEGVGILTAEPSMGLYRIQEHVRRTLPQLVDKKLELQGFQHQVEGVCYDMEYSIRTVQSLHKIPHFTIIKECIKSATISKKNIEEAETMRQQMVNATPPVHVLPQQGEILSEGFICPICMEKWNSQEELLDHWKNTHSPSVSPTDSSSVTSPSPELEINNDNEITAAANEVENSSLSPGNNPQCDSDLINEGVVSDNSIEL